MKWMMSAILVTCVVSPAFGEVQTKEVSYKDGDVELQGHLFWDDAKKGKRPGVLVIHEWWGLDAYAKRRAKSLARMGYVAFALDMYGNGKITKHAAEAGKWAKQIGMNIEAWKKRAAAGLKQLQASEHVDKSNIAAIGYCFGGATVVQMAYGGLPVKGVVSFHGSLPVATDEQAKNIKAKILICHGAADSFIPASRIKEFTAKLEKAKADYQFISYAGAKHSFTNKGADKRGIDGLKYDKSADRRSWAHMRIFFREIFAPPKKK